MDETYPGQSPEETTQFVIHKHWASVAPFMLAGVVMLAVSLFAIYYGGAHDGEVVKYVSTNLVALLGALGSLITLLFFVAAIWVWRQNRVIVTNEHVVDIDQVGLFNRKLSVLHLGNIQDVSVQEKGPMQTTFKYGSITIQTAGERENFLIEYVPDPYGSEQRLHQVHQKFYSTDNKKPSASLSHNPLED